MNDVARAERVDLHGVVDDQLGGDERVDPRRVAAHLGHRVAHGREVDDAGTPVKSCMTTRAGVKAISLHGSAPASQVASASMSAASTEPLPSVRSRFSSRTFSENGRRATS